MNINLTGGLVAVIDDADYALVCGHRWRVFYAKSGLRYATSYTRVGGKQGALWMHRLICGLSHHDGKEVDHRDGDGLNNTRLNMQVCTHSENMKNRKISSRNRTGYKGVGYEQGAYRARIRLNYKEIHLGRFSTPEAAHEAYKEASARLHGEFGCSGVRTPTLVRHGR